MACVLTRSQVWERAVAAGDACMRQAGRDGWTRHEFAAMIAEFDRLDPGLDQLTRQQVAAYLARRLSRERPDRRVLRACVGCGMQLTAVQRRKPCPVCASRNPR